MQSDKRTRDPPSEASQTSLRSEPDVHQHFPSLSGVQCWILGTLARCTDMPGMALRMGLNRATGRETSGPAFYQLMSRMVDSELVEGFDVDVKVNRYVAKERRYRILPAGETALSNVKHFYWSL